MNIRPVTNNSFQGNTLHHIKRAAKYTLGTAFMLGAFAWAGLQDTKNAEMMKKYEEEAAQIREFNRSHIDAPLGDTKEEELINYKDILSENMAEAKQIDSINTQEYLNYCNYSSGESNYAKELEEYMSNSHKAVDFWTAQHAAVKRLEENDYKSLEKRAADSTFVYSQIEKEKERLAQNFINSSINN